MEFWETGDCECRACGRVHRFYTEGQPSDTRGDVQLSYTCPKTGNPGSIQLTDLDWGKILHARPVKSVLARVV